MREEWWGGEWSIPNVLLEAPQASLPLVGVVAGDCPAMMFTLVLDLFMLSPVARTLLATFLFTFQCYEQNEPIPLLVTNLCSHLMHVDKLWMLTK